MKKDQFEAIIKWQNETFGESTSLSKVKHLLKEVDELGIAITYSDENIRLEFADCLFLLFGAASKEGMTYDDICAAIDEKLEINKSRVWGKPDADGVVENLETCYIECISCNEEFDIWTMPTDDDDNHYCKECYAEISPVMKEVYDEMVNNGEIERE
ncbi:MAG: hypothetical protein CMH22_06495 [Methylophaga sp.]|nr:hypothetical protein [Christiangramia sp.]MAX51613.1 hypothetical protein [Methylophaga sp.]|tara:strand:- start:467 stop:937 length:471 start_codon:yes stop_codon:yes gene_type:complete